MISQCVRAHPNPHFIGRRVCLCYVSKAAFPSPLPPRPNHCGHLVHLLPLGAARARSIPLRARVECRHCIAPWHLWQSRSSFACLFVRSAVAVAVGVVRSVGVGLTATGGIIYNGFSKPNYPTRRVSRSVGRPFRVSTSLSLPPFHHSAYVMMPGPAAGELPRIVFLRTRGAIIIGTNITIASPQIYSRHPVKVKVVTVSCNGQPPLGVTASRPWKLW